MEDLSADQQKLLKTNFGSETEKVAAEQAKIAKEMYAKGQEIALSIADSMDKEAAELEKKASADAELPDPQQEKVAAQMGAFIERGQYDGLRKLGSERHGNEWHYILPFVEEKVATASAKAGVGKFREFLAGKAGKAREMMGKHPGKAAGGAAAAGAAAGFAGGRASKSKKD
jgi:hypothetical protein